MNRAVNPIEFHACRRRLAWCFLLAVCLILNLPWLLARQLDAQPALRRGGTREVRYRRPADLPPQPSPFVERVPEFTF